VSALPARPPAILVRDHAEAAAAALEKPAAITLHRVAAGPFWVSGAWVGGSYVYGRVGEKSWRRAYEKARDYLRRIHR
jgi:hypothetical protein